MLAWLNRGFDVYDDVFGASPGSAQHTEAPECRADRVIAAAIRWLEGRQQLPFFCWVHLNDPHTPYDPPEPYKSRYAGRLYDGEVAFTDAALRPLLELLRRKNWSSRKGFWARVITFHIRVIRPCRSGFRSEPIRLGGLFPHQTQELLTEPRPKGKLGR